MKTHTLYVKGTHCSACKILIEDIVGEHAGIKNVCVDLKKETVQIETDHEVSPHSLAQELGKLLEANKYEISTEKMTEEKNTKALAIAVPLGFLLLALFFALQKTGFVNFGLDGELTPFTPLLIGVVASFSTCLAVVGGLVLSLSAQAAQNKTGAKPFVFFHAGRLIGFGVLGGVLGALSSVITINPTVHAILGLIVAFVMVILGINLLGIWKFGRRLQLSLPRGVFDKFTKIERGLFAPFITGIGTFFLPCGFTQSMQIAALSSGSFGNGALIMLMFALGTLPTLALISFGSLKFSQSTYAPYFYKTSGVVVIGLGIIALLGGLAALGIIAPLFTF